MARRRPPEPTANPARGAILVVVAVVIGLFLLRNGLDTSEAITSNSGNGGSASDGSDPAGDGGDADGGTDGTTTTTQPPGRPPAEVPTIVLNDSGVPGAAGKYSDALAALGYQLTNPTGDNAEDPNAETTVIYFAPGFDADAAAVAFAIGAPDNVVPEPLPTAPPGPIADASVVVVIGSDLANVAPASPGDHRPSRHRHRRQLIAASASQVHQ